jgi:protein-disulfide isomerase
MEIHQRLLDDYVNSGMVYLVYRDFPMPSHAHARAAARYVNAAARIGKWELIQKVLFERQATWSVNGDFEGSLASVLSADELAEMHRLVTEGAVDEAINSDLALARSYHLQ